MNRADGVAGPGVVDRKPSRSARRGSILILIVWMVTFFSMAVLVLSARGSAALGRTQRFMESLQSEALALGALEQAALVLREDTDPQADGSSEAWARPHRFDLEDTVGLGGTIPEGAAESGGSEAVVWHMADEERKLPLNSIPRPLVHRLLSQRTPLKPDEVSALTDAILDWRDEDSDEGPEGAEDFYYQGRADRYECKDGPFENLEELLLVRGMTPGIFARIAPHLTVHGNGMLNINTAGDEELRALGLSDKGVAGVMGYRSGGDGVAGTADDRMLASAQTVVGELAPFIPVQETPALSALIQTKLLGVQSSAFRVFVTAPSPHPQGSTRLECVIAREGGILEWDGP